MELSELREHQSNQAPGTPKGNKSIATFCVSKKQKSSDLLCLKCIVNFLGVPIYIKLIQVSYCCRSVPLDTCVFGIIKKIGT